MEWRSGSIWVHCDVRHGTELGGVGVVVSRQRSALRRAGDASEVRVALGKPAKKYGARKPPRKGARKSIKAGLTATGIGNRKSIGAGITAQGITGTVGRRDGVLGTLWLPGIGAHAALAVRCRSSGCRF